MAQQMPGQRTLPELVEAGGVAGHGRFEMVTHLTIKGGALADQIPTMANDQLQRTPSLSTRGFEQRATGYGSAMNSGQVGVISFVAGIDGLAVVLGDERMQDARLETGGGAGVLDDAVIATGAFDSN